MVPAGEWPILQRKPRLQDASPSAARVSRAQTQALTKYAQCKRGGSTAWLLYFYFPQSGTMRTTCALLILCTMTMPWSTQSRQRTECLRSSTSFTVSLRSVTPQQLVLCVPVGGGALCVELVDSGLSLSIPFCVCRSHSWGQSCHTAEVQTVLTGDRHPRRQHCLPASEWYVINSAMRAFERFL